jgi:formylglycine-generating enzyme required for sulfatase activity
LEECRNKTLSLFVDVDAATFSSQAHHDFSPVGWHLGHIAYIESFWILEHSAGLPCLFPQYHKLFAADGLPKSQRVQLPEIAEIIDYLKTVRSKVLEYLEVADILEQERLWRFLIQHESQHCEIIRMVLGLVNSQQSTVNSQQLTVKTHVGEMVQIPAGEFEVGNDSMDALDNERPAHKIYLDTYWIDRYPVTCGEYQVFIEAGGYQNPEWWSVEGWKWLQTEQVTQPLYWNSDRRTTPWQQATQSVPLAQPLSMTRSANVEKERRGVAHCTSNNHPVYGVSWYEAEAYSQFVGKRLPTEAEWEKAASWDAKANCRRTYPWGEDTPTPQHCNYDGFKTTPVNAYPQGQSSYGLYDTLGNVWEWTASWFDGYQGFASYPYKGYSQVYFDQKHRVLKGGSWASRPWILRSSFRNWYYPQVRQIFAGFRCVKD